MAWGMSPNEQWRPVAGYEGLYEVSDQGRVRSLDRLATDTGKGGSSRTRLFHGRIRRQVINAQTGYPCVVLCAGGQDRTVTVHTLVLEAFVGPRPDGMYACHNNGIKTDLRLLNLRWDTPSENSFDAVRHGNNVNAAKTHCKRGHEFTPENTAPNNGGRGRKCRTCKRITNRGSVNRKLQKECA